MKTNGSPGAWLQGKLLEMLFKRLEHVLVDASASVTEIHFILYFVSIDWMIVIVLFITGAARWKMEMNWHRQSTDSLVVMAA